MKSVTVQVGSNSALVTCISEVSYKISLETLVVPDETSRCFPQYFQKSPGKILKLFYDRVPLRVTFSPLSNVLRAFDCIWYEFLKPSFRKITINCERICRLIFENFVHWP